MSVDWLQNKVYESFHRKPTKEDLTAWLREYHSNFLLFVYQAHDGAMWGQWEIPEKLLGRYRLAADKKSPEPPAEQLKAFRSAYVESLRARHKRDEDVIADGFGSVPQVCETLRNVSQTSEHLRNVSDVCESVRNVSHDVGVGVGVGVGVVEGVGVGVGEILAPASPEPVQAEHLPANVNDPRHTTFRGAVKAYWRETVGMDAPWDGSEGKALANLLRANPKLTLEQFSQCLRNRAESHVQASDRPRRWLECVTDYLSGPRDAYGKPLVRDNRASVGMHRPAPAEDEAAVQEVQKEFWRIRRGAPDYEAQAPAWIKRELAAETVVQ